MALSLPSLNAMRVFEAAEELHVSPGAVSQQIKVLEQELGTPLFVRHNRTISLTQAGRTLAPALREAFQLIAATTESLRGRDRTGPLTISVLPSFAAKWLVPRLGRFMARQPEIDVRISSTSALVDFAREDVDLAVRHGLGDYAGLRCDRLFDSVLVPVCSPALLKAGPPLREPGDLRHHILLHGLRGLEWGLWLKAQGVEGVDATRGPRFSDDGLALEAAIEGQGVAISRDFLVSADVMEGVLVKPFTLTTPDQLAYFVVCPLETAELPKIAAFREWLLEEAQRPLIRSV